jgi:5'-nucleotidase
MALAQYGHSYEKREDPAGRDYYWALWSEPTHPPAEEADVTELRRGNVTLTPLKFDLTEQKMLGSMSDWDLKG